LACIAARTRKTSIFIAASFAVFLAGLAHPCFAEAGRPAGRLSWHTGCANAHQRTAGSAEVETEHTLALRIAHEVLHIETTTSPDRNQALPDSLARTAEFEDLLLAGHVFEVRLAAAQALGVQAKQSALLQIYVPTFEFGVAALVKVDKAFFSVGCVHSAAAKIEVAEKTRNGFAVVACR
jgi:hypothetical protein